MRKLPLQCYAFNNQPLRATIQPAQRISMSSLLVILVNLGAVALFIYVLVNALF